MLTTLNTIADVRKNAVRVTEGMSVFWPQSGEYTTVRLHNLVLEPNKMLFSYNNSVVAFIDQSGTLFAIPNLKGVLDILKANGYKKGYFYVPFSNWDVPVDHKDHWQKLWDIKNHQ